MGITLTDVLLFGKAQSDDVDKATLVIYRRNILRWSALGGYLDIIVKGVSPLVLPDAIADSLSYVKAFGGTEQRNIPQPYTQVNYVTNTAQTAVDTGIMIDFAKNYEFEVECRAVSGSWYILQSRASASGNVTGIHGATSGSTIILVVGNVTVCTSAITRTVGNKLYVKATLNNGTATLYVKDETANTEDTQTGSYGTTQPNPTASVYLLGNAGEQYVDVNSDIYMARIKENDTVVMDYVPARQVATAGFYDTVSGTFKTALTPANLSADGNTVPTPDAPMDIVSNNGVLKVRHQSGLPWDYTLLDYIESTGTQYIDTGITYNSSKTLKFIFDGLTTDAPHTYVMGWNAGGMVKTGGGYWDFYDAASSHTSNLLATVKTQITMTINSGASSNTDYKLVQGSTEENFNRGHSGITSYTSIPFPLFAVMSGALLKGAIAVYGFKVYSDNVLVQNLIPCKNSSNVVGMYDLVSGQFFTNAGTGDFTAGTAVSDPVEIYTDGTVETIWSQHQLELPTTNTYGNITESFTYSYNSNADTVAVPVTIGKQYIIKWTNTTQATVGTVFRYGFVSDRTPTEQAVTQGYRGTIQDLPSNPIIVTADNSYLLLQCNRGYTITNITNGYLTVSEVSNTATAEMLLKVGDYQDVQSIIDGVVTRNIGVKVLDGTENWEYRTNVTWQGTTYARLSARQVISNKAAMTTGAGKFLCSHSVGYVVGGYTDGTPQGFAMFTSALNDIIYATFPQNTTAEDVKQWLADQYNAGRPVIIVYPLATPTTGSVTGQTLQVTNGDNVLEITQASLNGLELEAEYQAAVSLTIQEVQDANLDPNVEVTIN